MVNTRGEEEMAAYVRARGSEYDAVVLAWTRVASGLMPVLYELEPRPLICFDTNDVNHVREYRHARVSGNANILRRALAMKQAELAAAARSDLVIAISEADAAVFRAGAPTARVEVITLAGPEPRDDAPGPAHREGAFYVGNFEAWPNIDAMEHLIGDILPAIRDERPEFGLSIAGSGRPGLLDALAGPGVEILGYVPDLRASFDAARMFLVPLRAGSGIKGKVLNAMANGLPVVATPVAVEGMELRHGVDCLIADSAAGQAQRRARQAGDDELWSRLQREALRTVGARFGMAAVREQAARAFRPLLSGARLASP